MGEELELFPMGLRKSQIEQLTSHAEEAASLSITDLIEAARRHLDLTRQACVENPIINVKLATTLFKTIEQLAKRWDGLAPNVRYWLSGAMLYFAKCRDDEPDFTSPIGFEDDTEVLNACLRLGGLDELCISPEDYDDV